MPTATLDHQDIAGLQVPRQNGEPGSSGTNLTASSSYGLGSGTYGSPENSTTTSALDTGNREVCQSQSFVRNSRLMTIIQLNKLRSQLEVENRVKDGAENLLNVPTIGVSISCTLRNNHHYSLPSQNELRQQVEIELAEAKKKIANISEQMKTGMMSWYL